MPAPYSVKDKRFIEGAAVARYNGRLKEIGLLPDNGEPEYRIWHYEAGAGSVQACYWVCRNKVGCCPVCGTPYAKNAIAGVKETYALHYAKSTQASSKEEKITPVEIVLRRNRWRCYNCYKNTGRYNDRWDDDSSLVEGNERMTVALKKYIAVQSLRMEFASLARKFEITEETVKKLFKEEVQRCDDGRSWDNIKTLGLYTISLKVKGEKEEAYCLCTDADKETFIELFPWSATKEAEAFLSKIKNKECITRVLTSVDAEACNFAAQNFPAAERMVDRADIRQRLLDALEQEKQNRANAADKNFPYLRRHWNLLDHEEKIDTATKEYGFIDTVKSAFPRIACAYDLKEAGFEIYRRPTGQAQLVDDWLAIDKQGLPPFEELEAHIQNQKRPVVEFASRYFGVDRVRYEKSLRQARTPMQRYTLSTVSLAGSRAAMIDTIRGQLLYGTALMYNWSLNYAQEHTGTAGGMNFQINPLGPLSDMGTVNATRAPVSLHNFGIPLEEIPTILTNFLIEYRAMFLPVEQLEDRRTQNPDAIREEPAAMDNAFDRILAALRDASTNKRQQGALFERLIKQFLLVSPVYSRLYDAVWLWSEFPGNGGKQDTGIDLVAHLRGSDGEYCAIQCKFYEPSHAVDKADVDTFLSASGKPFFVGNTAVYYTQRLIVSTTDNWTQNAEDTIVGQRPPVNRISLRDLQDAGVDWDTFKLDHIEDMRLAPKKKPREHQKKAIESVLSNFNAGKERGKLIMACGTGKTLTALKIAERITEGKGNVLVLVPSINLLNQTLSEWVAQCAYPSTIYAICSDPKASRVDDDSIVDTIVPATTNVDSLISLYSIAPDSELQLYFSTYQSINVIHDFQQRVPWDFDLVICDEAHRTTGVTLAGEDESNFVRVHDNSYIRAKRRLYMTATPRIYAEGSKQKADQNSAVLCSMDDETIYGPEFYRLGFSDAVSQGLLSDYKVIVLAVDENFVSRSLQQLLTDKNSELKLDDAVKIIGCMNGLAKKTHFPGEENYFVNDPQPMRRAVAFTTTIAQSKKFVQTFEEIQAIYKINTSDGDTQTVELQHVDGKCNALVRKQRIDWLKKDSGENRCHVLSNARCLSEGVDVPALDAVIFLNPRKSIVDIVQSVGRVMRKSEGKKYGYIILPIGIPAGMEPEEALADNEKYRIVWDVLQALRAHDDRFNNTINRIDLNRKKPDNINIIGVTGGEGDDDTFGTDSEAYNGTQLSFDLTELQKWKESIYAKIVKKCGSRQYWETWAKDIADIAARHVAEINLLLEKPEIAAEFDSFLAGLRHSLNPSIDKTDAVEMLAQHLITKPVFDALFDNYSFLQSNPVSQIMQSMLDTLNEKALDKEQETLSKFYASVQERAKGIDNAEAKQRIILELYEKFFKNALPKETERLGIVYTPVEVVDFIIQSVEYVMQQKFGHSISDMGVHVLDPFTGTGTFIVRLLRSGIIKPADLLYKYTSEIHCNEIVLLAYYIAAVNIEETYHDLSQSEAYVPFEGIVLTDTFELAERVGTREGEADRSIFQPNADRATKQMQTPIQVIIGNPPYSVGQRSGNDDNKNLVYPNLDAAVANTYTVQSKAALKRNAYDTYIKAFRWATDRIGENGIIAFVTNGAFIDGIALDGFRKSIVQEFNSIYIFNLRGNQRTSGETSRKEGGKIFGSGSRTPVAITVLVKKKGTKKDGYIRYHDIGDYLSREQKLSIISDFGSIKEIPWQYITPDENGDWINQRNPKYQNFIALGDKKKREKFSLFADNYAMGLSTNRDAWVYSYDFTDTHAEQMIDFYNAEILRCEQEYKHMLKEHGIKGDEAARKTYFENSRSMDAQKISWSQGLLNRFVSDEHIDYGKKCLVMYRPYCKRYLYYQKQIIERPSKWEQIFPDESTDNIVICISGAPLKKPFSAFITNQIQDLNLLEHAQCFPLYYYEKETRKGTGQMLLDGTIDEDRVVLHKRNALSDATLNHFVEVYGPKATREDIFYYIYAVLHCPAYIKEYGDNLSKEMPRVPMLAQFPEYVRIGRALADLHLNYERPVSADEIGVTVEMRKEDYTITDKMRFGKNKDLSVIEYNPYITIRNIPAAAYDYIINGKSAVEWIVEQYAVTVDKASGIVNDPNTYAGGKYIFDLLLSIISVSLKTQELIAQLPPYKEI